MEHFKTLFPSATLSEIKKNQNGYLSILRPDGKWFNINTEDLTEREQLLLEQLDSPDRTVSPTNPWYNFLVKHQGKPPSPVKLVQYLHVRVIRHPEQSDLEAEWLNFFSQLLPNLMTSVKISQENFVFILNQELNFDVNSILAETLASLEFDFGIKMTALLGQVWSQAMIDQWPTAYQLEAELFNHHLLTPDISRLTLFPLSLLSTSTDTTAELYQLLATLILHQDEMEETIKALWQEQAVLTKAAQRLYIHRNTLQYRLDKFQEQTGLSLKNMDDLAVCYIALIKQKR